MLGRLSEYVCRVKQMGGNLVQLTYYKMLRSTEGSGEPTWKEQVVTNYQTN
jgi:hypothetical protein